MHVTWWNVVVCIAASGVVLSLISECRSATREARRLRDLVIADGNTYRHSDAFAKQRRTYQRKMWWQLPIGLVALALGVGAGLGKHHWAVDVYFIGMGLWALTSAGVAFVCMRILGPSAPAAQR